MVSFLQRHVKSYLKSNVTSTAYESFFDADTTEPGSAPSLKPELKSRCVIQQQTLVYIISRIVAELIEIAAGVILSYVRHSH